MIHRMLKVWIAGPQVGRGFIADEAAHGAAVIAAIEAARPSAKGQLSLLRRWDWQRQPLAGGIYHHIAPGQGAMLAAATAWQGARLHFAGEASGGFCIGHGGRAGERRTRGASDFGGGIKPRPPPLSRT